MKSSIANRIRANAGTIASLLALGALVIVLYFGASTGSAQSTMPAVDQKKACLQCHDDLKAKLNLPHPHSPAAQGKCSQCHNPHASQHQALLADDQATLCSRCHAQVAAWATKTDKHPPVSEGKCVACHDPHGSKNDKLLKENMTELCARCHTAVKDWKTRPHVHSPFRNGQCDRCHDPHGSNNDNFLVSSQATICMGCHSATAAFTAAHRGFDPATSKCSACHDPHSSSSQSLLMENVHPPFKDGSCDACHTTAKAGVKGYPLQGPTLQVCATCHEDKAKTVKEFSAHGSNNQEACEKCHNAHASHEKSMLAAPQKSLCVKCHDPTKGVQTAIDNPHTKLACTSCHAPHGSSNPFYFKASSGEVCGKCHQHQHNVTHPMGPNVKDPRNGSILSCTSCHKLHAPEFPKLLQANGDRDLCVRCHTGK